LQDVGDENIDRKGVGVEKASEVKAGRAEGYKVEKSKVEPSFEPVARKDDKEMEKTEVEEKS
jgi:hypothetical protein